MSRVRDVDDATVERFRTTPDVRLRERLHAVLLSRDGRTRSDIAEILYCELSDVKRWIDLYNEGGLAALEDADARPEPTPAQPPEAPSLPPEVVDGASSMEIDASALTSALAELDEASNLSQQAQAMVRECLRFSPRIYGRKSRVWSTGALADILRQNLGTHVPRDEIRSFLSSSGMARLATREELEARAREAALAAAEAAAQAEVAPSAEGEAESPEPPAAPPAPTIPRTPTPEETERSAWPAPTPEPETDHKGGSAAYNVYMQQVQAAAAKAAEGEEQGA